MSVDNEEQTRFANRQRHYRGSAKVKLKHLRFDTSAFLDAKNVTRLTQIFELEGCHRLDLEHRVPATIKENVLQSTLRLSNITTVDLMRRIPPKLELPTDVELDCLHGKHRIAAAKKFLYLPDDKWWTVDLYADRLSHPLRRDIREDYANSRNFCDGDIFRQIRFCQINQDHAGEGRWWARLSDSKRKDVKQLQRSKELKPLALALDELLPYVGFWPGLRLGTFHRLLNVKCPEELRHYVHHIRDYWLPVLDHNHELKPLVDFGTVRLLQTRNPWASAVDNDVVKDLMRDHILFPLITDFNLRSRILKNILATDCIIPSLYTFIEDTKWLEPCAKAIRNLLPTNCRKSTYKSMFGSYQGANIPDGVVVIQKKEAVFIHQLGSERDAVECGYRQLWLFAWRHFPELSAILPRKNAGKAKPRPKASHERCWHRFAGLARSLGFESDNIDILLRQDTDAAMALEFICQARPDYLFQVPYEIRTASALEICHILRSMEQQMNGTSGESRSRRRSGESRSRQCLEISPQLRCGRPYEQSHQESKSRFFYPDIYATKTKTLTHFSINRDIFHAFFGSSPRVTLMDEDTDNAQPVTTTQADTVSDMDEDTDNAQPVTTTQADTVSDMDEDTDNAQPVTTTQADTVSDMDEDTDNAQPVTTTQAAQPVTTTLAAQPVTTTQAAQPVTTTQAAQPVTTTQAAQPVTTTQAAQPVTTTQAAQPVTTAQAAQPVTTTQAAQPVTTAQAAQPVTTTQAAQPVTTAQAAQPDVSPISERPEEPEGQKTTGGGDLVLRRDEIVEIEQQSLVLPQENDKILQTQSMNQAEVVPLFEMDLQASFLFDAWESHCKIGDIFAVSVHMGVARHYSKEPETELGRGILPEGLKYYAGSHYFATYIPEKKTLKCIGHDSILKYARDSKHDGVIYILRRPTDDATRKEVRKADRTQIRDETCQSITAETTKVRLFKVVERLKKKRRQPSQLESETYKLQQTNDRGKVASRGRVLELGARLSI
ncbi:hypothetical protein ABVK25_010146 [Lepraria finkii]|uniref:Uncharacterized protein n=1 Tax=Lepraria finkii TaxID=1340010 RepID=A0ABR4AV63_9LECA